MRDVNEAGELTDAVEATRKSLYRQINAAHVSSDMRSLLRSIVDVAVERSEVKSDGPAPGTDVPHGTLVWWRLKHSNQTIEARTGQWRGNGVVDGDGDFHRDIDVDIRPVRTLAPNEVAVDREGLRKCLHFVPATKYALFDRLYDALDRDKEARR